MLNFQHDDSRVRTAAEISAGVTPVNYAYGVGGPIYDARRYGLSTSASASTNSAALQNAVNAAWQAGGGVVYVPAGIYDIDAPILVYETVSMLGDGENTSVLRKTTATASAVSDSTTRFYDGATVGNPVCVLHFVDQDGTSNWAYAQCRNISVKGNTTSPNTTTTDYGFYFRGMTGGRVVSCFAEYVKVGFFWGDGATITSEIGQNLAGNVQRGFHNEFMTSTTLHHNYANNYRYLGYFFSAYYSHIHANACDNGGTTWKVGTTEIALAYNGNSCANSLFCGNGNEETNGSCYKFTNCLSTRFENNLGLNITSSYTGGSDICLWENDSNRDCVCTDNRMQTVGMTGTGARHFIYKITSELGNYVWQRNRFVATLNDSTDTSTWTNISGSITETTAVISSSGTFTPTVAGSSTAGTTTYTVQSGSYERKGNVITFRLRVDWSGQTGTGNLLVGGLPFASANTNDNPISVTAGALTFSGQLVGMVRANSTTIDLYAQATGAGLSSVAIDTAATLYISGSYLV